MIIGNIKLQESSIFIDNNEISNDFSFSIADIKKLVIKYCGVEGEHIGTKGCFFSFKDGTGNFLKIKSKDQEYNFDFLVKHPHFLPGIRPLLEKWREQGIKIVILNQYNDVITGEVM